MHCCLHLLFGRHILSSQAGPLNVIQVLFRTSLVYVCIRTTQESVTVMKLSSFLIGSIKGLESHGTEYGFS